MNELKILSVVVVYNPPSIDDLKSNISLLNKHSDVVVVFNDQRVVDFGQKFSETPNNNVGTSGAYNIVIKKYLEHYKYLWLWDQDSIAEPAFLKSFLERVILFGSFDRCGIFSFYDKKNFVKSRDLFFDIIHQTKSSGTLLKRSAIEKIGNFDEALFLDYVDYEYIRRASYLGINTVQFNDIALLSHQLGGQYPAMIWMLDAPAPIRLLHQKRGALYILKLRHFPILFKIKLLLRIIAWIPFSLLFSDRFSRLKALWSQ